MGILVELYVKTTIDIKEDIVIDKAFLNGWGDYAKNLIMERTRENKDVNEKKFKKYTKRYANYRRKHGKGIKPNLWFSGEMMQSIARRSNVSKKRVTLYFLTKFSKKKASGNMRKREFFGFQKGTATFRRLVDYVKKYDFVR